jgi:hypothetical protein
MARPEGLLGIPEILQQSGVNVLLEFSGFLGHPIAAKLPLGVISQPPRAVLSAVHAMGIRAPLP